MNALTELLILWLADYFLLATLLLIVALVLCRIINQPARRLVLARPTLAALFLLSGLCAMPGWSLVHLMTEEKPTTSLLELSDIQIAAPIAPPTTPLIPTIDIDRLPQTPPIQTQSTIETTPTPSSKPFPWPVWLVSIYLGVCLLFIAWQTSGSILARRLLRHAAPAPPLVQSLLAEIGEDAKRLPNLLVSNDIQAPAALGVFQPTILLPQAMLSDQSDSLRPILAHELAHIRHGDLRTLAAARLLTILLWPQPLYWLLRRQVRLDQETLADAAAADVTNRTDYAEQLVAWARTATDTPAPRLASSVGLWESPSQLKQRVAMLLDEKLTILRTCTRRWRISSAIGLFTIAVGLSLVTLAPPAPLQAENQSQPTQEPKKPAATPLASSQKEKPSANGTLIAATPPADSDEERPGGTFDLVASSPVADADADTGDSSTTETEIAAGATALSDKEKGKLMRPLYKQLRDATKPNTIHGICIDENGQPLAGVLVEVFSRRGVHRAGQSENPILTTRSDKQGKFRFVDVIDIEQEFPEGLPEPRFQPSNVKIFTLVGRIEGRTPGIGSNMAMSIARRGDLRVWVMQPAQTLRGRVTDEQGQAVAGAQVRAGFLNLLLGTKGVNVATTDANGEYEINDLPAFSAAVERRKMAEAKEDGPDLALSVTGTRDPREPLVVKHPKFAAKRVLIENIPDKVDVQLVPGSAIEGTVQLPKGEAAAKSIAGSLVHLQRVMPQPKPGERPSLYSFYGYQIDTTMVDESGHYRFESLPAGKYHLTADVKGWVTQGVENVEVARGETATAPDILLMQGGRVRIQLVDDKTGKPMHFEKPTKGYINPRQRPRRPGFFYFRDNITEFSTEGIAEKHIPAGRYVLHVSIPLAEGGDLTSTHPNNLEEWPTYEVKDGEVLDISLPMEKQEPRPANLTATGTISPSSPPSDESTEEEKPKPKVIVTPATPIADADSGDSSTSKTKATTDATALSGKGKLKLMRPLYKQLRDATKPNMIHGICIDENGQPLAGVLVEVFSRRGVHRAKQSAKPILTTKSDKQGKFRFVDVVDIEQEFPEGLSEPRLQPSNVKIFTFVGQIEGRTPGIGSNTAWSIAKGSHSLVWVMQPAQTLRGRIVDQQGNPVEGAQVSTGYADRWGGSHGINQATTNANGEYAIADLAAYNAAEERRKFDEARKADPNLEHTWGTHDFPTRTVFVKHPDFAAKRATIKNVPGKVDVQLVPGSVIEGRVAFPTDNTATKFPAGSIVRLERVLPQPKPGKQPSQYVSYSSLQIESTPLDETGHYRFESLPAGKYHLSADVEDWVTQGVENVEVARGETATAPDILLQHGARVRVQLVDDKTGEPLHFEKPTKGYINPIPRPLRAPVFRSRDVIAEFSTEGVAEKKLPAGKYALSISVPIAKNRHYVTVSTIEASNIDDLATYEIEDGELLEISVRMRLKEPTLTSVLIGGASPADDESTDDEKPKPKVIFTPATPPAEESDAK